MFSNIVTTVSPTYAQEVLKPEVRIGGPQTPFNEFIGQILCLKVFVFILSIDSDRRYAFSIKNHRSGLFYLTI